MMTRTHARAHALKLAEALLSLIAWLLLGPFLMVGFFVGLIALCVKLIVSALIEGFLRGYHHQ